MTHPLLLSYQLIIIMAMHLESGHVSPRFKKGLSIIRRDLKALEDCLTVVPIARNTVTQSNYLIIIKNLKHTKILTNFFN